LDLVEDPSQAEVPPATTASKVLAWVDQGASAGVDPVEVVLALVVSVRLALARVVLIQIDSVQVRRGLGRVVLAQAALDREALIQMDSVLVAVAQRASAGVVVVLASVRRASVRLALAQAIRSCRP